MGVQDGHSPTVRASLGGSRAVASTEHPAIFEIWQISNVRYRHAVNIVPVPNHLFRHNFRDGGDV